MGVRIFGFSVWPPLQILAHLNQKGLEVCYCFWGCHPDPRLGPILGPSRSHPGSRRGPVQIRHVLCFPAFRTHPGPEVGAIPARLVPSWSRAFLLDRAWTGRNRPLGHFRLKIVSVATPAEPRGEKKLILCQFWAGEKLLKFVEKCR